MMGRSTTRSAVLLERHALHPVPTNACRLERDVELGEVRASGKPAGRRAPDVPRLLLVDHLERMPERAAGLLLHLDDEDAASAAKYEVELVATHACVRREQAVSAESIVAEGDSLAPVHAAS